MKILYHHRTLADGAEGVHIAEMVAAFRALGHEVLVLGVDGNAASTARPGWLARLRKALPPMVLEPATVALNAADYVRVRSTIRSFQAELLYKRHARNDIGALTAARHSGVPSVLEVNCLFTGSGYRAFEPMAFEGVAAALERHALRIANARIAVSTPLAGQITKLSGMPALIVPNGVNISRFDPALAAPDKIREKFGLGSALVIGWTGVIREWHGLELLLDAIAQIPAAHLFVAGDGPARGALQERAHALRMSTRFTVTGRIAHTDMPSHIAAMDIAVVAADRTGVASPMKLLEYMAMGRAVIAPRLPNIEDVLSDASLGRLFRPDDLADLVMVLRELANDAPARQRLGEAARHAVLERRSWNHVAREVLTALSCTPPGEGTVAP